MGSWADESDELEPLSLSEQPVWTQDDLKLQEDTTVDFAGSLMVLHSGGDLSVLDPATGATVWSIGFKDELPGTDGATWYGESKAVDTESGGIVLVDTYRDLCADPADVTDVCSPEHGVAALNVGDGSVLWATGITPGVVNLEENVEIGIELEYVDQSTALIAVIPSIKEMSEDSVPAESVFGIALDVGTGAVSWTVQGAWPIAATSDTVFAVQGEEQSGNEPTLKADSRIESGAVVGLDRASGTQSWQYSGEGLSELVLAVDEYALVRSGPEGARSFTMIDSANGNDVADLGGSVHSCRTDGSTQVSCALGTKVSAGQHHVLTFDADSGDVNVATTEPPGGHVTISGIADRYIFVSDLDDEGYYALDPTGADTTGPLPGEFLAMNDKYAVFATYPEDQDTEPTGLVVHEVTT